MLLITLKCMSLRWFSIFWIKFWTLTPCDRFTAECGNPGMLKSMFSSLIALLNSLSVLMTQCHDFCRNKKLFHYVCAWAAWLHGHVSTTIHCVAKLLASCARRFLQPDSIGSQTRCSPDEWSGHGRASMETLLFVAGLVVAPFSRWCSGEQRGSMSAIWFVRWGSLGHVVRRSSGCHHHFYPAERAPRTDNRRASNGGLPESAVGRRVPSSTVSHWCRSSTGKRRHVERTAEQAPSRGIATSASTHPRVPPESPLELDRDKFLQSLKTAPRGSSPGPGGFSYERLKIMMDEEDTLELLYEAATSLEQAKVHRIYIDECTADSAFKERWRSPRCCNWMLVATSCRESSGQTVQFAFRGGMRTVPIRSVDPSRHGLCWTPSPRCHGRQPLFWASTESERSITFWAGWRGWWRRRRCSHLCCCPTVNLPPTVGMMIPAKGGKSPKQKAGSRVTRWCLFFSRSASKALWKRCQSHWRPVSICALSSTTFTWCASQIECDFCTTSWLKHCPRWLALGCTKARHAFGTQSAREHWWYQGSGNTFGEHKVRLVHHGGKSQGGTEVVGGHPIRPGLAMCLADFVAERKSTRKSFHPNNAAQCVREVRSRTRRGHLVNCQSAFQRGPKSEQELTDAAQVASLPMRMGGLGLRSAQRCAHAAYWASWADALPMIKQRTPAMQSSKGALGNSGNPRHDWTVKGSGGDQLGALFLKDRDHQHHQGNLASGHTVGSIEHFPSRTLTSGKWLAPLSHTHQQQGSTQCHHIYSACCSWNGCDSRFLWQRRCVKVVMPVWTFMGTIEQRAPGQGGWRRGQHPQSAPWPEYSAKQGRESDTTCSFATWTWGPCSRWEAHRGSSSRPPVLWRCPIGCGHHFAERSDLQWRTPSPCSRRGRRNVGGSRARQRSDVPGTCCFRPMQTRGGGHWDRREVEWRRSCLDEAPRESKGTRSTQTPRAINEPRLGTPLDQNVLDGLRRCFCSVTGGSSGTVWIRVSHGWSASAFRWPLGGGSSRVVAHDTTIRLTDCACILFSKKIKKTIFFRNKLFFHCERFCSTSCPVPSWARLTRMFSDSLSGFPDLSEEPSSSCKPFSSISWERDVFPLFTKTRSVLSGFPDRSQIGLGFGWVGLVGRTLHVELLHKTVERLYRLDVVQL